MKDFRILYSSSYDILGFFIGCCDDKRAIPEILKGGKYSWRSSVKGENFGFFYLV